MALSNPDSIPEDDFSSRFSKSGRLKDGKPPRSENRNVANLKELFSKKAKTVSILVADVVLFHVSQIPFAIRAVCKVHHMNQNAYRILNATLPCSNFVVICIYKVNCIATVSTGVLFIGVSEIV